MKRFIASFFLFFIVFGLFSKVYSADSSYYSNIFSKWGFKNDTLEINDNTIPDENLSSTKFILSTEKNKDYLLLLSSQISEDFFIQNNLNSYKTVFLICDKNFKVLDNTCLVNGYLSDTNVTKFATDNFQILNNIIGLNISLIAIPQNYFITPASRQQLEEYISALGESYKKDFIISRHKIELSPFLIETAGYTVSILLFLVVFYGILINLKSVNDLKKYKEKFILYYLTLKRYRVLLLLLFVILFCIYIFGLAILSIKKVQGISITFILNYVIDVIRLKDLDVVRSQYILIYSFGMLLTLVLYFVFDIFELFRISVHKIQVKSLNINIYKWGSVFLALVLILLSLIKVYSWVNILILLCLFYIIDSGYKNKIIYHSLFSYKEKLVLIIALFILIIGATNSVKFFPASLEKVYRDLIGVNHKIVMLPYYKDADPNEFFQDYSINVNFPVFIDDYLIYDKKFKNIYNKNIKEFKANTNYIIVGDFSSDEFIKDLVLNNNLLNEFRVSGVSNLIKVNNDNLDFSQDINISIIIDCSIDIKPTTISIAKVNDESKKKLEYNDLLYFLGCNNDQSSQTLSYKVPFNTDINKGDIFYIKGIDFKYVKAVLITAENKQLNIDYYKIPTTNYFSKITNGNDVYVYGSNTKNIDFTNNVLNSNEFSISPNINKLKENGFIGNQFTIWTIKPFQILKVNEN